METIVPLRPEPRSPEELSRLVHLVYEAAARPQAWSEVVAAIGASLGASKGLLVTPFVGPEDGGLLFPWQIPEWELQLWASRYIAHDIWSIRAREGGLWRQGAVYVNEDLVSTAELRASVFYKEFLSQHGIEWICTGIVFDGAPGLPHTSASFFRERNVAPFSPQDKAWLQLLLGHLSRALGLMHRLAAVELRAASLRAALDRMAFGVALLNGKRQLLHMNAAGQAVLARNDGLTLGPERELDAPSHNGQPRLQQWLARSAASPGDVTGHFCSGFFVARRASAHPYVVQYAVLAPTDVWDLGGDAVRYIAFITDPAATRMPSAERLAALYGLTPAESRVAVELAHGKSQKEVASALDISVSTARTHTQNVFAKLHVRRHADLVRMVLALAEVAA